MKEFVAEIVSNGRLRSRNLVPLLGYCRRKGELLLVYEHMPNGSLDKYLYGQPAIALDWSQRFRVIKSVASGLLYLHEEWGILGLQDLMILQMAGDTQSHYMFQSRRSSLVVADTKQVGFSGKLGFKRNACICSFECHLFVVLFSHRKAM
ncbi:hypothetical protein L3X38_034750 [Prunus dulcis]|uniref:Protein kinase domain-containing protein n=1 Tax=Prunus dulcis TaxID=3755 RepID=A0AAD4VJG8_PRUDU|nr:hypothetical protein L3X38_034750 [Prunus dulcis]